MIDHYKLIIQCSLQNMLLLLFFLIVHISVLEDEACLFILF